MAPEPESPHGHSVNRSPDTTPQYNFNDAALAARALFKNITGFGATPAFKGHTVPVADPHSQNTSYSTAFSACEMMVGTVSDGSALVNMYVVHPDGGGDPVLATVATDTAAACWGPTNISGIIPGARVLVVRQSKDTDHYIVGSMPTSLETGRRAMHDYISQAARNRVDDTHKKYIKQPKNGGMSDYSAWRPYDATLGGDWGVICTTGTRITVDDFMVQAAVNDFCGLYGFYHDNMLRLAGYNMQVWTAGSERDAYMDQAEYNDSQGYTPYPWEGMGVLKPGIKVIEQYEPGCYHAWDQKPFYSRWENKHEFAQPYHRSQVFFGYIGQGMRQLVHAPPDGKQRWTYKGNKGSTGEKPFDSKIESTRGFKYESEGGPDKDTDHQDDPVFGLSEENKALDGRIFMASAKGIHITKRILLPFPNRIRRPEDVNRGDDASKQYKASSLFGNGEEHPITGTIKTTDPKYPNLQRAAALLDLHGYLYNYSGLHGFYWHKDDYKTWEQQELGYADYNQKIPTFTQLAGRKMYLKEPNPKSTFKIDHRYDKNPQHFYETESYISLLEDGGICIGDGYGGEIRMTGGCVFISAPGDVWCKAGRDVQLWGGHDVITRARNTVDISCTEKNVRIKAEEHVLILGGNKEEYGGVIIESKAKQECCSFECGDDIRFCGIALKAPCTRIDLRAKDLYLGTNVRKYGCQPGMIVIDADDGRSSILTKSANIFHYIRGGAAFHFFGDGPCEKWKTEKANMFSSRFSLICGPIGTDGHIILDGSLLSRGSGVFTKGHVFTEQAKKIPFVAPAEGLFLFIVDSIIQIIKQLMNVILPFIGDLIHYFFFTLIWCNIKCDPEFSFRLDRHYKIPDFLLYEDRWQQMARLGGEIPDRWTEKPVKTKCGPTYPYPGKKWLLEEPGFAEQDFKIVQTSGGYVDKERNKAPGLDGVYRNPIFKEPSKKILNGNYVITPRD